MHCVCYVYPAVLLQENATMGITDIAKEAGVRWKALSEQEKEPFVAQAMQDKARYTEEVRIITLGMLILPIS